MAALIVVAFVDNVHRATGVLDELRVLDDKWITDMRDAVAVHRQLSGALRLDQTYQPTAHNGTGWGAALGFFIGATLALSFTAQAHGVVAGDLMAAAALGGAAAGATSAGFEAVLWENSFGIPDVFLREVGKIIQPGSSAIYAIFENDDVSFVIARFQALGGLVRMTDLTEEQQTEIDKFLNTMKR